MRCRAPGCSSYARLASLFQPVMGGKARGERMFTMLWSCLLPSLSASTPASDQRHRDIGGGLAASFFFLCSLPLFAPIFPSSTHKSVFLVFACPLKAKGLCALCMCVWLHLAGASGSSIFSPCEFPPSALASELGLSRAFSQSCTHKHTHTKDSVITLCSHVIPSGAAFISTAEYLDTQPQYLDSHQSLSLL